MRLLAQMLKIILAICPRVWLEQCLSHSSESELGESTVEGGDGFVLGGGGSGSDLGQILQATLEQLGRCGVQSGGQAIVNTNQSEYRPFDNWRMVKSQGIVQLAAMSRKSRMESIRIQSTTAAPEHIRNWFGGHSQRDFVK